MKITKAVIPVAGLGTRFLPATKGIAKEMFPIVDKPCLQYLVEEATSSGIKEIIFVVSREKKASIQKHFSRNLALEKLLKAKNQKQELENVQKIHKLAKFHYVIQEEAKGDGHAILCASKFLKNCDFAVLFGDDIHDSTPPALAQLISTYEKFKAPVIAICEIDMKDSHKYGMIGGKRIGKDIVEISKLIEKPNPKEAPSNLAISGKYIISKELFETLKKSKSSKDGELRIIDGMKNFIKKSPIYGKKISGKRFDTGNKAGYIEAVIHFALKHKNISGQIKKLLS